MKQAVVAVLAFLAIALSGCGDSSTTTKTQCHHNGASASAEAASTLLKATPRCMQNVSKVTHQETSHFMRTPLLLELRSASCTTSCRSWTALALVRTTPSLLWDTPTSDPIGEAGVAIVRLRRCHTAAALVGTALTMDAATPLLLRHRPARLPIRETISAIVGICRSRWHDRPHWRHDRHGQWSWQWTTPMMNAATPILLVLLPRILCTNSAVERIHRTARGGGGRGRWRRGRGWRRRREWGWRHCHRRLGQVRCWTTPPDCHAAIISLRLGPHKLCPHTSHTAHTAHAAHAAAQTAVIRLRSCHATEEPVKQRKQQKAQEATTCNDAGEISPPPHHVVVAAETYVFERRFLGVISLAGADIRQATASAAPTPDAACSAILTGTHATRDAIARCASCSPYETSPRPTNDSAIATACTREASTSNSAPTVTAVHSRKTRPRPTCGCPAKDSGMLQLRRASG